MLARSARPSGRAHARARECVAAAVVAAPGGAAHGALACISLKVWVALAAAVYARAVAVAVGRARLVGAARASPAGSTHAHAPLHVALGALGVATLERAAAHAHRRCGEQRRERERGAVIEHRQLQARGTVPRTRWGRAGRSVPSRITYALTCGRAVASPVAVVFARALRAVGTSPARLADA